MVPVIADQHEGGLEQEHATDVHYQGVLGGYGVEVVGVLSF